MGKYKPRKELAVTFASNSLTIPNVYVLDKVGAGHDGSIFRFNEYALKILKYDISLRKERRLMTFDKVIYFQDKLDLKRITQPIDTLLDNDGIFSGYVMKYLDDLASPKKVGTPLYRSPAEYRCGELITSWKELEDDFYQLSEHGIRAQDINAGSYLFTSDFMHLCDMDKYVFSRNPRPLNDTTLRYVFAKFLSLEMQKIHACDREDHLALSAWVKEKSNSKSFFDEVSFDIGSEYNKPISDYVEYKAKSLFR